MGPCPECGAQLDWDFTCPRCGYDLEEDMEADNIEFPLKNPEKRLDRFYSRV